MALSYAESLRRNKKNQDTSSVVVLSSPIETLNSDFTRSDDYEWYEDYEDSNLSTIDDMKNITIDNHQINISQETNSQFIPFSMSRYYDGVDLMTKTLWIHYVTPTKTEDLTKVVNVSYTDDEIQFGWLVTSTATAYSGILQFEIIAMGQNSKDEQYIWKSRIGTLNIIQSLEGDGIVEATSNLYELINKLTIEVTQNSDDVNALKDALEQITSIPSDDIDEIFKQILGN